MTDAYKTALQALRTFMRKEREENGVFEAGGTVMDATTMCVRSDGTYDAIPLDILSDPVNLKEMWCATTHSVAILFREWIYDWVVLIPNDDTLRIWSLVKMPGRDHDMHRARALAERAIQCDFKISDARVYEIGSEVVIYECPFNRWIRANQWPREKPEESDE